MSGAILAGRMGISSAAFYSMLNNPTLQSIQRMAGALGVPAYELLREDAGGSDEAGCLRAVCPHCGKSIVLKVQK